jgi:mannose-6-phosphate isomerase-like protein (cupin superfamily)
MEVATQEAYWMVGHKVRPLPTLGDYGLIEFVSYPGVPGPPPHYHDDISEFFYVAEGSLDVQIDGEWTRLEEGDSLCLRPGQMHTVTNRSDTPCRWISGWSPRGFERIFTDLGVPAAEEGSRERSVSEEAIGRLVSECASYGMIVPPPGD